jgi:alpha-tubulin suppressor-like RCC1 family protein
MKKSLFFILLLIQLFSFLSIGQQALSGKDTVRKGQQLQSDTLNDYGNLWGWGRNTWGVLGDGTNINKMEPIQIGNEYKWKIVCGSFNQTWAIKTDGTLWGTGSNYEGGLGDGTEEATTIFKQIGSDSNWKSLSNFCTHSLAIKNDSRLWVWGWNTDFCLGDSAIKEGSRVKTPTRIMKNWDDVIFISAGWGYSAAIRKGGTLYTWGGNVNYQLGDGTNIERKNPVQIGKYDEWRTVSCGYIHTLAIKKDGTLWAWGAGNKGILGDGTWDIPKSQPIQIGTDNNWVSVSACTQHSLGLKSDGTLWAWGWNNYFGLGDSTIPELNELFNAVNRPRQIGTDNDWVSISGKNYINAATRKDGSLWQWGLLPSSETSNKVFKVPTKIKNMSNVIFVDVGIEHTMFIRRLTAELPEVITLQVSDITDSTAESGGNVISDGKEWDCVRGICYATKLNPTITDSITINGQGAGKYQSSMKYLKPFTKYFVRAFVTNSLGLAYGQNESFWSNLPKPVLISPTNGNKNVPLNAFLKWYKVDSALMYRVQIAKNPDFDKPILDEETENPVYEYDKYGNDSVYYWRIQAKNDLCISDWSAIWSFTTSKFIPQKLLYPTNDTINVPLDCKLIWKQNSAKTTYILQVSKFQNFSQKVIDIDLADTVHQSSVLEYLTKYFWRVAAYNETDQSEWSPVWKFTTLMDSVTLKTPVDLSKLINIPSALAWEEGIYKKDYRLQISEADDFATTNTDTLISKIANADVNNLNHWQKYFWRVRNESGDTLGYWSEIWQFKTRMSDMLLMYPENTQTGLAQEINFKWYPVIGAEYYQLQISKNEQFTNMVYSKDSITTTEHFVPDLEKDILYYWRVRVWNTESIGTAYWSEVWTFRTGETGVKDETALIQIIPNPAGDFITITLKPSEGSEIQIYNTLGEKVLAEPIHPTTSSHRMDITDLPKGVYFVKIGGEAAKFVKM